MEADLLREAIRKPTDERLWALAEGLRRGWTVDEVNRISRVDRWFLRKISSLLSMEKKLQSIQGQTGTVVGEVIQEAFLIGFPSPTIASILGIDSQTMMAVGKQYRANEPPPVDEDWQHVAAWEIERQPFLL
jgi:carbamoyl-phosphate synthase large subunit